MDPSADLPQPPVSEVTPPSIDQPQLTQETQEVSPEAINMVAGLYLGDQMSIVLGDQMHKQRDELWKRAAQESPAYSARILELGERLSVVHETRKAYPPQIAQVLRMPFTQVDDEMAQEFLRDVLLSRMTEKQGYMDYGISAPDEANAMAKEMGLREGWRSEQAKTVTLESAVGSVLEGKIRISHVSSMQNPPSTPPTQPPPSV